MAFDLTEFDADLSEVTADMPTTVTHGGNTYSCIVTEIDKGKDLELEGFGLEHDLTVHGRTTLWTTRPVVGDKVTIDSVEYRVDRVITDPDDNLMKLNCKAV